MKSKISKSQFIKDLSRILTLPENKTNQIFNNIIGYIQGSVANGYDVQITGFGTFTLSHRRERMGISPKTGEKILISKKVTPKFIAGKTFKERVKNEQS